MTRWPLRLNTRVLLIAVLMIVPAVAVISDEQLSLSRRAVLVALVTAYAIVVALIGSRRLIVRPLERAHQNAEERMRFALEASQIGVWEANLTTDAAYWSAMTEAHHGLAPGTFGGTFNAFIGCVHEDDRARVREAIQHGIQQHHDADVEYRTVWPDGSEHRLNAKARFFYDSNGLPLRGAGVSMDVTEQHSLEEQFRQAQKMEAVGLLAGGVAHDFNNMLMAILGNTELLADDLSEGDPRRRDLNEITKAAERAAALTHQLLAFSRRQVLSPKVLHVGDVVNGIAPMLRRLLGETIDLRVTVTDRRAVKADAGQLEQVLMNLAVNARDAMHDGGRLTIETTDVDLDGGYVRSRPGLEPGPYVMVSVSDTGCGMDAITKKRIFEPFFTTKPVGEGTGLGLATVYGIVTQSGGHIAVDSEPGHGTTFLVYVPHTSEKLSTVRHAHHADVPRGDETILVVEDEAVVRELVTKALTKQGYHVHTVASPGRAIEFAAANATTIDLILTDVVLPEMTGPAMVQELREHDIALPVIYMSGYTDQSIADLIGNAGSTFMQKPFTGDKLATTVRRVLDHAAAA